MKVTRKLASRWSGIAGPRTQLLGARVAGTSLPGAACEMMVGQGEEGEGDEGRRGKVTRSTQTRMGLIEVESAEASPALSRDSTTQEASWTPSCERQTVGRRICISSLFFPPERMLSPPPS